MYSKEPHTIDQQIARLRERGFHIEPEDRAEEILSNISYYRLAGYWWPMQSDKVRHIFKPNSRFKDVVSLYNFDRCDLPNLFTIELQELFEKYPNVDPDALGMKLNWTKEPLWEN